MNVIYNHIMHYTYIYKKYIRIRNTYIYIRKNNVYEYIQKLLNTYTYIQKCIYIYRNTMKLTIRKNSYVWV